MGGNSPTFEILENKLIIIIDILYFNEKEIR